MKSTLAPDAETNRSVTQASIVSNLLQREFLFVTGKGGVGKSTVTAALGSLAAHHGRRVLLAYPTGAPAPVEEWNQVMTEVPTEVAPGLSVVRLDPELAMRKYTADALRSERLASILFHSKIARGFLTGIPGPRDWAILGQAWSFSRGSTYESKHPDDRYDLVIVDGPSSGDGANMLRVPEVIIDLAVGARLRKDAESCLAMLRNKERTAIVLVTLSEELPLREAEESLAVLRDEMALPVGALFVNEVVTPLLSEADRNILRSLSDEDLDREAHSGEARSRSVRVLDVGRRRAELEARQARHEKRIEEMGLPVVKLPALPGENQGKGRMRKLQIALAEGH